MVKESTPSRPTKARTRVPRGTLSREVILDAAFRLVDDDPAGDLTMSRLGRELGADPSAVYRHFRSKDELLRAMADLMIGEALTHLPDTDDPVETIRTMAWSIRRSFLRRPSLTRVLLVRFTGGAAEEAWGARAVGLVQTLGYDEARARLLVRSLGEITTAHMSMTAEALALPRAFLVIDLEKALSLVSSPSVRLSGATDEELRALCLEDGDVMFDCALELLLHGLVAQAPTPSRRRRTAAPASTRRLPG